jgi:pimeloyl-ACP methyl ester carboxylesterase
MSRWVFVHGWTREARHWGPFVDDFRAFVPGAEVQCIDLPGTGERHRDTSPLSVAAILERCRPLSIREPVYLLGISMGGMVVAEWATRHPGEVAGLVLIDTSMRRLNRPWQRLRPRQLATVARAIATGDVTRREALILGLVSNEPDRRDVLADRIGIARERPVSRTNVIRQLLAATAYRGPLAPPVAPVLVLTTDGDRLVDPACSRRIARAWNAPIAAHPTAGHEITLDDGPWVAAQVRRWLASREA